VVYSQIMVASHIRSKVTKNKLHNNKLKEEKSLEK